MAGAKKPKIKAGGFYSQNYSHWSHLNQYSMNKKKEVSRKKQQDLWAIMGRLHKAWIKEWPPIKLSIDEKKQRIDLWVIINVRPSTNQEAQSQSSRSSRGDATSYDDQKMSGAVNENVTSS